MWYQLNFTYIEKQKISLYGSWKRHNANGKQIIEAEDAFQPDEDNNGVKLFFSDISKNDFLGYLLCMLVLSLKMTKIYLK